MTQFNAEHMLYNHDLHAFLVDAAERYQRAPIQIVPDVPESVGDGVTRQYVATVPFASVALPLAQAFIAGQQHPSTPATFYTVQHSRWYARGGTEHEQWEIATRGKVVAQLDNEADAIAEVRRLNSGETCGACEPFTLLAAQVGAV